MGYAGNPHILEKLSPQKNKSERVVVVVPTLQVTVVPRTLSHSYCKQYIFLFSLNLILDVG